MFSDPFFAGFILGVLVEFMAACFVTWFTYVRKGAEG